MSQNIRPNNVEVIPESDNPFLIWMRLLGVVYSLSDRESELVALYLKKRYDFIKVSDDIDEETLDELTFSLKSKSSIRDKMKISPQNYQCLMSRLHKKGILIDGRFNPRIVPRIKKDNKVMTLGFVIEL